MNVRRPSEPQGLKTISFDGLPFLVLPEVEERVRGVWKQPYPVRSPFESNIRSVLDVGAGCGEWSVWAWRRWGTGIWIDCIEWNASERRCLYENKPPGSSVIALSPFDVGDDENVSEEPGAEELRFRDWLRSNLEPIDIAKYDAVRISDAFAAHILLERVARPTLTSAKVRIVDEPKRFPPFLIIDAKSWAYEPKETTT